MKFRRLYRASVFIINPQAFLLAAMLLMGTMASAQVLVKGNVYGGCELGQVTGDASVTVSGGTIGDKIPLADRKADANGQVTRINYGNLYGGGNGYDGTDYSTSVPSLNRDLGLVKGNTSVTVNGDAVVRHAVYGGGNLGTVGVCTVNTDGTATYTAGGKTTVTIEGTALIGPTKADLTTATDDELNAAATAFGMATMSQADYTDTAFKYLGGNEGMVFGGSRGISGDELKELSFADTTEVIIQGSANVVGNVFGGGENGHVQKGSGVLVQGSAVIGGVPLHGTKESGTYEITSGIYAVGGNVTVHLINTESYREGELIEDQFGVGRRVFRGNVFGGGKGNDFVPWLLGQTPPVQQYSYSSGDVYGNATVKIKGGTIYNKVYGGGTMASVGTFLHTDENNPHAVTGIVKNANKDTGQCYVEITGGQIGTNGCNNGDVFGGGRGAVGKVHESGDVLPIHQTIDMAYVGHTHVTVDGASIKSNVYGGSANGHVQGNAKVLIKETTTGTTVIGTQDHGGWHSNVFGGGGGTARYREGSTLNFSITSGRVFGNTDVEITGGKVWHNVYGGGAIASVGTYDASSLTAPQHPYLGYGHAKVSITGGTIGYDGNENGMVFGSGRGEIAEPGNFLDYVTYVAYSEVNIGTGTVNQTTGEVSGISGDAKINGSVYGSGENGHVYLESKVNVFAGTIGCTRAEYDTMSAWYKEKRFPYRGNVYGAGCGTDEYGWETLMVPGTEPPEAAVDPATNQPIKIGKYNPLAGITQGNTKVNIHGGYISHSVYGGGAMASVGLFTKSDPHNNAANSFALSWPYEFVYQEIEDSIVGHKVPTGKTEITITGGHIGTYKENDLTALGGSGDVYGGSRGMAGNRYDFVPLANVKETVVHINYSNPVSAPAASGDFIVNSVFGGGENGHVYKDTQVTIDNAFIGGTVFGGGKGKGTYWDYLLVYDPNDINPTYPLGTPTLTQVHSITAGKVFGNTEVTINNGVIQHNVFGGGEYASVGIGNYFGYGELTEDQTAIALTTTTGKATVKINGGTIGTLGYPDTYGIGNGFVYGSSKGVAFPNVNQPQTPPTPRFDYSRDFFLGYTNETDVTIGQSSGSGTGPTIWGSVFGGGEDGHVRFNTEVTVKKGEIGEAYAYDPSSTLDSTMVWVYRGNVYGAGRGIDKIASGQPHAGEFCSSAGSVTLNTNVTIEGGTIHRNVYGGGSNASVGPPPTGYYPGPSKCTVNIKGGTIGNEFTYNNHSYLYGGDVYGAGRGHRDLLATANIARFATSNTTEVNLDTLRNGTTVVDRANVLGNVYGGGEIGQVKQNTVVNVKAGTVGTIGYAHKQDHPNPDPHPTLLDSIYHKTGGKVFGGGKGESTDREAAHVMGNTEVNLSGGHVLFNVYGGGELASVGLRTPIYADQAHTIILDYEPKTDIHGNDSTGFAKVTVTGGQVGPAPIKMNSVGSDLDTIVAIGLSGTDGYVFGGGMGIGDDPITTTNPYGLYYQFADVNNAEVIVNMPMPRPNHPEDSINNRIWGSIFGGAEDGHLLGNAKVQYISGLMGTDGTTSYDGNIFGGGRNYSRKNYTAGRVRGNDTVVMCGGTIFGSIFGGGRLAVTGCGLYGFTPTADGKYTAMLDGDDHGNIYVKVNGGTIGNERVIDTFLTYSMGDVYGGGKGTMEGINVANHPKASALLLAVAKNATIVIADSVSGNTKVTPRILGSVYGGGEVASLGHHEWKMPESGYSASDETIGDIVLKPGSGRVDITVSGGIIGADKAKMRYELAGNANAANFYQLKYNDDRGHVFGGGEGLLANPDLYATINPTNEPIPGPHNNKSLVDLVASVGETHVTITKTDDGQAWVKGSVYGGGMNGHVLFDANVLIEGGQIGAGDYPTKDSLYLDNQFVNPATTTIIAETETGANALRGCVHWKYEENTLNPFDPLSISNVANYKPTDGKTWFGNVFGGGSGFYPYYVQNGDNSYSAEWNREAGKVYGNTRVEITGGHILTNVYGGCETTDVGDYQYSVDIYGDEHVSGGEAKVIMSGGSVGIPRVTDSITAHPIPGYVYGSGKGDPRLYFNTWTNVWKTYDTISGGTIYGSLFGGGEDGHVFGDVAVEVSEANPDVPTVIGSVGNTGAEGNVFGAGRGTTPEALTAGSVGGNVQVDILGGKMLGSVFGGGNLSSVGIYLVEKLLPNGTTPNPFYGQFHEDETGENPQTFGHITVNVKGGRVGNDLETATHETLATVGGNVYGGSRGRYEAGTQSNPSIWPSLARVKQTEVNISDEAVVKSSVYGGGKVGIVRDSTMVTVSGGTIGWSYPRATDTVLRYGSVYGGGEGILETNAYNDSTQPAIALAGRVYGNTKVIISGGKVREDVFGGGNLASVGRWNTTTYEPVANTGKATVTVSGGEIGPLDGTGLNAYVFGGGKGIAEDYEEYANLNNTYVTVSGGKIWGSVFGGGNDGHTLGNASVKVQNSADIGTNGLTSWDGNIFGGGRNFRNLNHTSGRVAGNIDINMTGGTLQGSIFGGGRLALTGVDVNGDPFYDGAPANYVYDSLNHGLVTITVSGTNDTVYSSVDPSVIDTIIYHTSIGNPNGNLLLNGSDESVGDIFGSGKGDTKEYDDIAVGRVANTKITLTGCPRIYGSVFGGGEMAGIGYWDTVHTSPTLGRFMGKTGASVVTIGTSATDNPVIGTDYEYTSAYYATGHEWTVYDETHTKKTLIHTCTGNVFGGSQGDVDPESPHWVSMGRSRKADVVVNGGTVKSWVYGGAEQGTLAEDASVAIHGGTIGQHLTVFDTTYYFGGVFGGGYGSHRQDYNGTTYDGNAITNDSTAAHPSDTLWTASYLAGRVYGNTHVTVDSGLILGDVYGGSNYAYLGGSNTTGNTEVFIGNTDQIGQNERGTTIKGSVFGGNNHAGTPCGNLKVHIISTKHVGNPNNVAQLGDCYPTIPTTLQTPADTLDWMNSLPNTEANYAIKAVYGGSNQADYLPVAGKKALVYVHECDENTIYDVYGGCNAANMGTTSVPTEANVIVEGGRIYRVFGGGNGEVRAADIHTTANTEINGGLISQVFGGSNNNGLIEEINLNINHDGHCPLVIYDNFGGGNNALVIGDVVTTVECGEGTYGNFYGGTNLADIYGNVTVNIFGAIYNNLFGGSKGDLASLNTGGDQSHTDNPANIKRFPASDYDWTENPDHHPLEVKAYLETQYASGHDYYGKGGNVTLNIFGGDIQNAFGGSNYNGNIEGQIQVNVFNAGLEGCGLDLVNLYGASNETAYSPNYTPIGVQERISPVVNVIHGTVKGSVFGGGKGSTATTTASPEVNIGYDADAVVNVFYQPSTMGPANADSTLVNTLIDTIRAHTPSTWTAPSEYADFVKGSVYGGGELAQVADSTAVFIRAGRVEGCVYGGGMGSEDDEMAGLVKGNTLVSMTGGQVDLSIYGGGALGSVGTFTYSDVTYPADDPNGNENLVVKVPSACTSGGLARVLVSGGKVGGDMALMPTTTNPEDDKYGWIFCGSEGEADSITNYKAIGLGVVNRTYLQISNTATTTPLITASVYGGCENGMVLGNTHVKIMGGQIGVGHYMDGSTHMFDGIYNEDVWTAAITAIGNGTFNATHAAPFHECDHWPYGYTYTDENGNTYTDYYQYDIFADEEGYDNQGGSVEHPSDGHSFFGNVFGGGSGYYPIAPGIWRPTAGLVKGNTHVEISGGHILTNVYGGNEITDVLGTSTVTMTDGTIGIPRTRAQMMANPSAGFLFGGSMGDPRDMFANKANVGETEINISGGTIFKSVFGGSEDGHVLGDANITIDGNVLIGTTGKSSYDGNIFGGGRNLLYRAISAGSVRGNIQIDMSDGLLLGNLYGGGSMGLTGMDADGDSIIGPNHGYVTINIDGGTIGSVADTVTIGNVFGGGKGMFLDLETGSDQINAPYWGRVKNTQVNIRGTNTRIYGSVYGGGELGYVLNNTSVAVSGGVIGSELPREDDPTKTRYNGSVYGGGKGFDENYILLPLQKEPGSVLGNAYVLISGGQVLENVFGGGEIGSVGEYEYNYDENGFIISSPVSNGNTYVTFTGGQVGPLDGTGLNGYVYGSGQGIGNDPTGQYIFISDVVNSTVTVDIPENADPEKNRIWGSVFGGGADGHVFGNATVNMKSGIVGTDGTTSWDGNIFGGGRNFQRTNYTSGRVGGNIFVNMEGGNVLGSIFGGGRLGVGGISGALTFDFDENDNVFFWSIPHMIEGDDHGNVTIDISGGTVGNESIILGWLATSDHTSMGDVFGGGKGIADTLYDNSHNIITLPEELARVKNTHIKISGDAKVLNNVYGGGELANVGWVTAPGTAFDATKGGLAKIEISGGQVGIEQIGAPQATIVGGNVYGGGLGLPGGKAVLPFANVDTTRVAISDTAYITGSVFGGADNGHVWRNTSIEMIGGTVGQKNILKEFLTDDLEHPAIDHIYSGSVLAGGRGITPESTVPTLVYNDTTGRVFGNTNVKISGGTVRHAVYGGGGLSSVGTYTLSSFPPVPVYPEGGKTGNTYVTIEGNAFIGPTRKDLTNPTAEDLAAAKAYYGLGEEATFTEQQYADTCFKYLGGNAGWVFGAGCGLADDAFAHLTAVDSTFVTISGNANVIGAVYGGGESGKAMGSTEVNVTGGTIGGLPLHGTSYGVTEGAYYNSELSNITLTLAAKDSEIAENELGVGKHVFRGSVFGGGKGTDYTNTPGVYSMYAGRVYGDTWVNVSGNNTKIYNRVYGGGAMASVGKFTYYKKLNDIHNPVPLTDSLQRITYLDGGVTHVTISGGTIGVGTNATDGNNQGYVIGGGRGLAGYPGDLTAEFVYDQDDPADQVVRMAYVKNTNVIINGTAKVKGNVYGGSVSGHVYGDANVIVDGDAQIGYTYDNGTKVHGDWHSNVFGGGGGQKPYKKPGKDPHLSITAGRVYGNTKVEVKSGTVYHNVYGGGPIASVGSYDLRENRPAVAPNTGKTEVIITGGTIGLDGEDNGHVFGSGRGYAAKALAYLDSLSYAVETHVTIGTESTPNVTNTPTVWGSVYGSGENGHTYLKANVNIHSGTVNHSVYGAGEGDETFIDPTDNKPHYNPIAGCVQGNTEVKMTGGLVKGNVYGGGRLASVGILLQETQHQNAQYDHADTVVWIAQMPGVDPTAFGNTKVEITGGTIGRVDGHANEPISTAYPRTGFVFGGGKGRLLDPTVYPRWTELANVSTTQVTVGGNAVVKSSVYGGSEEGRVLDSTWVKIQGGEIGETDKALREDMAFHRGNVFGGGSGNDSINYSGAGTGGVGAGYVFMREAGRVNGNARVEMTGGQVYNSVYGGCEVTSVGIYGIADDAYHTAHPEVPVDALYWKSGGKSTVTISGGNVGWKRTATQISDKPRYGFVYGAGKGDPRTYFNTWTNVKESHVTITTPTSGTIVNDTIFGCVFGGGEEGHVLGNTYVKVQGDTLTTWIGTFGTSGSDGNVFGSGRGKSPVALTAGGVGGNTNVDIEGGRMLGSIFGGGANSSVGIYFVPPTLDNGDPNPYYGDTIAGCDHGYTTVNIKAGTIGHHSTNPEDHIGGNVYGGCRGTAGEDGSIYQRMAKVKETHVNISQVTNVTTDGQQTHVMGSVFGSGEDGHVLKDTYVTVSNGQIGGKKWVDNEHEPEICSDIYHGNVYGSGRGLDKYEDENHVWHFSTTAGKVSGNTNIEITGGRVVRNVYGGGNLSSVGEAAIASTGLATVNVLGGFIGTSGNMDDYHGNVFGGGHGGIGGEYINLAYVKNTHVTIDSTARIFGSVFGGGEDGHVRQNTLVDVKGGIIGKNADTDMLHGNVYGGGRGLIVSGTVSPTAGEVYGHTEVNIMRSEKLKTPGVYYTPEVYNNVYGGGSRSVVGEYKVVNVSDGLVHDHVFGGSRDIPSERSNKAPRWVNMWGGTVEGNVYGCSYNSIDDNPTDPYDDKGWASFINLSGGTVGGVFGAGYGGHVNGSVGILIGKNAIDNDNKTEIGSANTHKPEDPVPMGKLDIKGSVFAGGDQVTESNWGEYAVTGYSNIYIDGTGYNTTDGSTAAYYMNISGGLFGSGSNCEAGEEGHNILVREFGTRNSGTDYTASRTLTTIQRCDTLLLDHVNIKLSGAYDISNQDVPLIGSNPRKKYGVLKADSTLLVTNASSIILGATHAPAYMDSLRRVRSLYLKEGAGSVYQSSVVHNNNNWEWIGVQNNDNKLYRITSAGPVELTANQENIIRFNDMSKLWVRYHKKIMVSSVSKDTSYYGELQGFFRLRADGYDPYGDVSFAYARPKYTSSSGGKDMEDENTADGGFLSYRSDHNFFTDFGDNYTNTKQYPYVNQLVPYPEKPDRGDRSDYRRLWVYPQHGNLWYVDGTRGWGRDILKTDPKAGRYPNTPKKTISGRVNSVGTGIISDENGDKFSYKNDHIYVVGALSAALENGILQDSVGSDGVHYPLKLYRYPGGHKMSNNELDYGTGTSTSDDGWVSVTGNAGPGANYGAMLVVEGSETTGANITLRGVYMDGLHGYSALEVETHEIPSTLPSGSNYDSTNVSKPMILTHKNSTLTLEGGTELRRGYNNTDAGDWYTNPDYKAPSGVADLAKYHGGAIFVDSLATVNVEGLVTITENKQKKGDGTIESNVYLPTFNKSLSITNVLDANSEIGITSPKRNKAASYVNNTFSPVAVATRTGHQADDASKAWQNCNFLDDQGWFFVNGHSASTQRTTYYKPSISGKPDDNTNGNTVYFGWTWANVVRQQPAATSYEEVSSDDIGVKTKEGMAWLISQSAGMNGQTATNFSGKTIRQTADFSLGQYVWVPIGDGATSFAGTYDGQGHLIDSVYIEYIGIGDKIYERNDYGLFGRVNNNGKIKRTFVVDGKIRPAAKPSSSKTGLDESYLPEVPEGDTLIDNVADMEGRGITDAIVPYNIGGLVGYLEGNAEISNSEAAITVPFFSNDSLVVGGLVGLMTYGTIHSSMAMPYVNEIHQGSGTNYWKGMVGGLVGSATGGKIQNSFASSQFGVSDAPTHVKIGGLLGKNTNAKMSNCYMALRQVNSETLPASVFGSIAASNTTASNIDSCYVMENSTYSYVLGGGSVNTTWHQYTPVISSNNLGYMCADNKVIDAPRTDTTLFQLLNNWVDKHSGHTYSRWARPGLSEVNGDLPVLLLDEFGTEANSHLGDFRSVATYKHSHVLQYGGPVRDGYGSSSKAVTPDNELDGAIGRMAANDALFVYGDITSAPTEAVPSKTKISVFEDAAILHAGTLGSYDSTYVGITFDNSSSKAVSTPGINNGLVITNGVTLGGSYLLPRDWHMMSTPLKDAPLGFDYRGDNEKSYVDGDYSFENRYNNPWVSNANEFKWLTSVGSIECSDVADNYRYWMKSEDNVDGYFPKQRGALFSDPKNTNKPNKDWLRKLFIVNSDTTPSDECYIVGNDTVNRYPYGMDFYSWTEPDYHWINFKRNGPNHWHSDDPHVHLPYTTEVATNHTTSTTNRNEDNLITAKGYMAAIAIPTMLQAHGTLNSGDQSINITKTPNVPLSGWNLVGNPFHAYLDFEKVVALTSNQTVLDSIEDPNLGKKPFYVIYNADSCKNNVAYTAFLYYPSGGSVNGEYADRFIHPHQGFYVSAREGGALTFTEGMLYTRKDAGDSHFRDERPSYPLINLYLSSDKGCADVTVVELERPEWGGARKLKELRVGNGLFYGHYDGESYAAIFAQKGAERVPIRFEAKEDDIFTIKWNTANADFHSLYLIDNITGVQYDMLRNDTYVFEGHKSDYKSRFYITFDVTGVDEYEHTSFVFFDGSQLVVTGEGDFEMVDVLGRVLMHTHVDGGQTRLSLPRVAPSVYFMRLTNGSGTHVQKIIIEKNS